MNNLNHFLNHRSTCPICHTELGTQIATFPQYDYYKKIKIHFRDDEVFIPSKINGWSLGKKSFQYDIQYVINKFSNDFSIEFIDKSFQLKTFISIDLLNKCLSFHNKHRKNILYLHRGCKKCGRYSYHSQPLHFNFQTGKLDFFDLLEEFIVLDTEISPSNYKIYRINNFYIDNETHIGISCQDKNIDLSKNMSLRIQLSQYSSHNLPLIPLDFSSIPNLIQKIDMYLLFS
jgi:hypothetical protein